MLVRAIVNRRQELIDLAPVVGWKAKFSAPIIRSPVNGMLLKEKFLQ